MNKKNSPTADRGTSQKTRTAVLDRHFPPRKKTRKGTTQSRQILPVSRETVRTPASDRLPDLLPAVPAEAPRKESEKPQESPASKQSPKPGKQAKRVPPAPPALEKDTGWLSCPRPRTDETPLVTHSIPMSTCEERQAKGYHKCGTCAFAKGRQFKGVGLPPLDNSPAHLQHARLLGLFGPDGEWLRR